VSDRPFSHPNFGTEARVEQHGKEIHVIFVAGSHRLADSMFNDVARQLQAGALNITMMGKPTKVMKS